MMEVVPLQKRSHRLLASQLLRSRQGFEARRFEWAFVFGSFEPDCNPLSYLRGSLREKMLGGHSYCNSRLYINSCIEKLQRRERWTIWQYYTLGKLTHYLADAFTYPHNQGLLETGWDHHRYETALRLRLAEHLSRQSIRQAEAHRDLAASIEEMHRQYLTAGADLNRDIRYILEATGLLFDNCLPCVA